MATTASLSAVAAPLAVPRGLSKASLGSATFRPLQARPGAARRMSAVVRASSSSGATAQEKLTAGLAAAAVAAALVLPEVAEAASPGLSPSLKNFLLSIVSGGVVFAGILGAVVAVSNFDPVKRT
ncbi:uncharacterized protein LOC100834468 [Brachypodium distachyon]|uniref:Ultraviolet-B-repressible protein n=1 Tax=Brachypodium distachyon TaxID=15368 RepID=I1GR84_BRADI|nr:uncharacterized protein LOC100834468 [Brachypodium distachyon]KQK14683.1 hypothetical protein BRADI_1g18050v3 [Brachypodium distachyon]|eukprot:XP_003562466.1 uncharacterized protein LOC100834468 [Brachypodium distachyon]